MTAASETSPLLRPHRRSPPWTSTGHFIKLVLAITLGGVLCVVNIVSLHSENSQTSTQTYDIIVVGSGPAGSVVASELIAKSPNLSVLLVEAGDATQWALGGKHTSSVENHSIASTHWTPFDVPFYWSHVAHMESFHWNVPNTFIAKALGGCGIHNAMLYVRALPEDISAWNMGPTWTWDIADAIYIATEDYDGPRNLSYHGYHGRVRTSRPTPVDSSSQAFLDGCAEAGLPLSNDFNAPNGRVGAGLYDFNIRDGVRDSAAMTFLKPLLATPSQRFHLRLNTLVEKINFDSTNRAVSVNVRARDGASATIQANKAIVLAAGAIHTPKLLTLSGIAAKSVLADLNLPLVADLPLVGNSLQDHPAVAMTFRARRPLAINFTLAWEDYVSRNAGWLSTPGLAAGAFVVPPGSTAPQLQLTFFPRDTEPQWSLEEAPETRVLVTIALLAPEARNRVVVKASDIDTPVEVEPEIPQATNEHLTPFDAFRLVHGIKVVRHIAQTMAMRRVVGEEVSPGAGVSDDAALVGWIYNTVYRNSHWVGTAKMGDSPGNGVVNQRLQVFNVSGLYVADASVIPVIPNGNVHSTVVMVASHAASLIAHDVTAP